MKVLRIFSEFSAVLLLVAFSSLYLDAPVALFFHHLVMSQAVLRKYTAHLPDLLLPIVAVITAGCWMTLLACLVRPVRWVCMRFMLVCGVSVPLAYVAKAVLQYTFGRVNPRTWFLHPDLAGFHWFYAHAGFASFPSGHMTVFVALAAVLWRYYPRFRFVYVASAVALGLALVATNYHFVSDVVAGTYLGFVVSRVCDAGLIGIFRFYRARVSGSAPPSAVRVGD